MSSRVASLSVARPVWLIAGLLLIAANLRAPVTGVAPVLDMIQSTYALTRAQAGLLTTLPLLAFGLVSPFAVLFARGYGIERTLFAAVVSIAAGVALRSAGPLWCLYAGTGIIGASIAIANVLLPSLVKRDFPARVPNVTGICALTMGAIAAGASAIAVPLAHAFGWRVALAAVILLSVGALLAWGTQLGAHSAPAKGTAIPPHGGRIWHSALAWQVTLFMGLNSTLYYVLVGWLPDILAHDGFSAARAGSVHGLMQLASAVPGLVLGPIVSRMKDQRWIAASTGAMMGLALLGFISVPALATLWSVLFGAGSGSAIILSLMFMSLRVRSSHQAAALSGMAQGVGYLLAACGPTLAGKVHDMTGTWKTVLAIGAVFSIAMAIFGLLAGRARQVGDRHTRAKR